MMLKQNRQNRQCSPTFLLAVTVHEHNGISVCALSPDCEKSYVIRNLQKKNPDHHRNLITFFVCDIWNHLWHTCRRTLTTLVVGAHFKVIPNCDILGNSEETCLSHDHTTPSVAVYAEHKIIASLAAVHVLIRLIYYDLNSRRKTAEDVAVGSAKTQINRYPASFIHSVHKSLDTYILPWCQL